MMLQERKKRKEETNEKVVAEIESSKSLLESVRTDDLVSVSRLLRSVEAEEVVTAALVAAREGHEAGLKLMLEAGAVECDARDENGWTLLRTAAWSGQDMCVDVLIQAGAQVIIDHLTIKHQLTFLIQPIFLRLNKTK